MNSKGLSKQDTILVTGATGRQGGAVASALLKSGWHIRAFVRNTGKARELAQEGAEIVEGNLDDPVSLARAMDGVHGVDSVQNFWEAGYEGEIRQGKLLADLAEEKKIKHLVYSSVQSAGRNTGVPHFESKWQIENYIRELKLPYTILRPVFFMENFLYPDFRKNLHNGVLPMEMKTGRSLQMVHVGHVGDFARLSFEKQFIGEEIDIASDEMTPLQIADTFSKVLGHLVKYVQVTLEESERTRGKEWSKMYEWLNKVGYDVKIFQLKTRYVLPLMDFTTFLYRVWLPQKLLA